MNIGATYTATNLYGEEVKGKLLANMIGNTPVLQTKNGNLHAVHQGSMKQVKCDIELGTTFVKDNGILSSLFDNVEHTITGVFGSVFGHAFMGIENK